MTTEPALTCPHCGTLATGAARFCAQCGGAIGGGTGRPSASMPSPFELLREQLVAATAGEYRILHELGRGGMAAVYLAEDLSLGRHVAVKVMVPGLDATEGMADRFLLEARTAAQLSHPNIIPIYAVRTTDQLRYFVMKYIGGRSLDRVLAETGPLPVPVVLAILAQVGSALEHAHRRGVVHRDIKPANIMLDDDGAAIVADFGIAKVAQGVSLTQTGSTMGTPTYMSPEQCTGKPVTGASDHYALGCVAFELLAGRPPFVHQEVVPVLLAHVSDAPPPLLALRADCPLELAVVVDKMLAKEPAERWSSLDEAVASAEAAGFASDPAVRAAMRVLGAAEDAPPPASMPVVPVSPLPRPRPGTPPSVTRAGIVASAEGPGASIQAPAARAQVSLLSIGPVPAGCQVGEDTALHVVAYDQGGSVLPGRTIRWSSLDPDLAIVDAAGTVHAIAEGRARIRAESEGQVTEATIEIRGLSGRLEVLPGEGTLAVGQVIRLGALWRTGPHEARPVSGAGWSSSDPGVLRITPEGELTGFSPGNARIRAAYRGQSCEVVFLVSRVEVASVRIHPRPVMLDVGESLRLEAQASDRLGATLAGRVVTWTSSRPDMVAVAPDGTMRGVAPGQARISAAVGGGVTGFDVRVAPVNVVGVRLNPSAVSLRVGESGQLRAQVQGQKSGVLEGVRVEWQSSDPNIAQVSPDGVVTGVRFGSARIAATAGGRRATMAVEVKAAATGSAPRLRLGG